MVKAPAHVISQSSGYDDMVAEVKRLSNKLQARQEDSRRLHGEKQLLDFKLSLAYVDARNLSKPASKHSGSVLLASACRPLHRPRKVDPSLRSRSTPAPKPKSQRQCRVPRSRSVPSARGTESDVAQYGGCTTAAVPSWYGGVSRPYCSLEPQETDIRKLKISTAASQRINLVAGRLRVIEDKIDEALDEIVFIEDWISFLKCQLLTVPLPLELPSDPPATSWTTEIPSDPSEVLTKGSEILDSLRAHEIKDLISAGAGCMTPFHRKQG